MNRNDLSFLEEMFQKKVNQIKESVLIVNQSLENVLYSDYENIRVINSKEFGLSKSRNLAIEHSNKELCWILDDDCIVLPDAVETIVNAHNKNDFTILTFRTKTPAGTAFYDYECEFRLLDRKEIVPILSPEITFKRKEILSADLKYNIRFGLGAQFQDSENFVFLDDALSKQLEIGYVPNFIVQHESRTSSDDVSSNRVIYARGALAGRDNIVTAVFYQFKYIFFLWRKGYVRSFPKLTEKFKVFEHGANDYLSGFEGHRINHPKQ